MLPLQRSIVGPMVLGVLLGLPLRAAEPQAGDAPADLVAQGGRALEAGDLATAESRFSAAVRMTPEEPLPWLGLSEVAERRGDAIEALRFAREAEKRDPDEPEILLAVSRGLARLLRVEDALESLARLREVAPKRPDGYLLAVSLLRRTSGTDEAIEILESGLAANVDDPRLDEELALVLLTAGDADRAISVAEGAMERFGDSGALRATLGMALAAHPERRSEAAECLEGALEMEPPAPGRVRMELASLLLEQGEADRALEHLRAAAELLPDTPEVHYRLGAALRDSGDMDGARAALGRYQELKQAEQRAAQTDRNLGTRFNEAQSLASQNQLGDALAAAEALLEEHPREDRVLALKGKVLFSLGRREEALTAIRQARSVVPSQIEYQYLEGFFLMQLGRAAEAELPLRRVLALDSDLAEGHALLGMSLSSQERYEEAVVHFERALALGVENRSVRLGFAEALRGVGREAESREQIEAAQRLGDG